MFQNVRDGQEEVAYADLATPHERDPTLAQYRLQGQRFAHWFSFKVWVITEDMLEQIYLVIPYIHVEGCINITLWRIVKNNASSRLHCNN